MEKGSKLILFLQTRMEAKQKSSRNGDDDDGGGDREMSLPGITLVCTVPSGAGGSCVCSFLGAKCSASPRSPPALRSLSERGSQVPP